MSTRAADAAKNAARLKPGRYVYLAALIYSKCRGGNIPDVL